MTIKTELDMDEVAERLANLICNPRYEWTDHILPPTKDRYAHEVTVVEEDKDEALCQREFEQVLIDGGSVGDIFGWYYKRDVELSQADKENLLVDLQRNLDRWRQYVGSKHYAITGTKRVDMGNGRWKQTNVYEYIPSEKGDDDIEKGIRMKRELEEDSAQADMRLSPSYDLQTVEIWEDKREEQVKVKNYLEFYVESMSPRALFKAKDRIFALRNEEKLDYDMYVKCMLLVLEQITTRCNSNWKLMNKFLEMQWQLDSVQSESVHAISTASMSLDMESAIDLMDQARTIANRTCVTVKQAMYSILENREEETSATWTPTLKEIL